VPPPEGEGDITTHAQTSNHGLSNPKAIQQRSQIIRVLLHCQGAESSLRPTVAAQIGHYDPGQVCECSRLRCPQPTIQGKTVHQKQSRLVFPTAIPVCQAKTVDLREHRSLLDMN
jgi:hypothetical protein